MLSRILTALSLAACTQTAPAPAPAAHEPGEPAAVSAHIQRAADAAQGERDHAQLMRADLNGDGIEDVIALYTVAGIQGGSNHVQHLAVFLGGDALTLAADAPVGAKGATTAESIEGTLGAVVRLRTYTADPEDLAGPGTPGLADYELVGEALVARPVE